MPKVSNAHAWFETNSGWAPPDSDTIAEWMADGVCRCPDECLVAPEGWCEHGLASWWLILNAEAIEPGIETVVKPRKPARRCAVPLMFRADQEPDDDRGQRARETV